MKILSIGNFTTGVKVDDQDYAWLSKWVWTFDATNGYVHRNQYTGGKKKKVYMHRLIMNATKGVQVDHKNGDRLDNRRSNLRLVSHIQNTWNREIKGARWHKASQKWMVQFTHLGKRYYFGLFPTKEEADEIHLEALRKLRGEFVR